LAQNTPAFTPHRTMQWNSTKSGAPSEDQVMIHKNTARSNFNAMLGELPKLRRNPRAPKVDGLLADTFTENASFGQSTATRTMHSRYNSAQKSKSSLGAPFKVPSYFFTPNDSGNLFNSMKQNKQEPNEPKAFVLTQPDPRIRKNLFEQKQNCVQDNVVSTDMVRYGPNFDLHMQSGPRDEMLPAKNANYKMHLGRKLCNDETERVKRHENIRQRQLEIQEETRVKQVIADRKENARDKQYEKSRKEEAKDAKDKFGKLDMTRDEHLKKTRREEKDLDNTAHKAGKDHHKDVEAHTAKLEADTFQYATDQHHRTVRDEKEWLNRRKSL
jgi:hypothetical protein